MALVKLRFDVQGEVQVSRSFDAYSHEVADMSTPLHRIGLSLLASVRDQFASEGARSRPWKPLSAAYAAWKAMHFGPEPILVRTGEMRADVLSPAALHVTRERLVYEPVGHGAQIAAYHQSGHLSPQVLPQRKIVDLTSGDRRGWEREFAEWITEVRRGTIGVSR